MYSNQHHHSNPSPKSADKQVNFYFPLHAGYTCGTVTLVSKLAPKIVLFQTTAATSILLTNCIICSTPTNYWSDGSKYFNSAGIGSAPSGTPIGSEFNTHGMSDFFRSGSSFPQHAGFPDMSMDFYRGPSYSRLSPSRLANIRNPFFSNGKGKGVSGKEINKCRLTLTFTHSFNCYLGQVVTHGESCRNDGVNNGMRQLRQ